MNEGAPIIIKKKKGGGHGHHGGAWKVAYADFVTAMMAFFMTLWIVGMASENDKKLIAAWFRDPIGFEKAVARSGMSMFSLGSPKPTPSQKPVGPDNKLENEHQKLEELRMNLRKAVESGSSAEFAKLVENMDLKLTTEGLEINFLESSGVVFFELGSATIRPEARKLIARIAPLLAASKRKLLIDGHTDSRPFPSDSYDNWDLSSDRAAAMRRELKRWGLKDDQVLSVRGFAATRPRVPENPMDPTNRRVSVLLPFSEMKEQVLGLPADTFKGDIEGAFRPPVPIAPSAPDLRQPAAGPPSGL